MDKESVSGQEVTGLKDKTATLNETAQTWPLRRVGLRVHDLAACIDYYTQLGFSVVKDERDQQGGPRDDEDEQVPDDFGDCRQQPHSRSPLLTIAALSLKKHVAYFIDEFGQQIRATHVGMDLLHQAIIGLIDVLLARSFG